MVMGDNRLECKEMSRLRNRQWEGKDELRLCQPGSGLRCRALSDQAMGSMKMVSVFFNSAFNQILDANPLCAVLSSIVEKNGCEV